MDLSEIRIESINKVTTRITSNDQSKIEKVEVKAEHSMPGHPNLLISDGSKNLSMDDMIAFKHFKSFLEIMAV